MKKSRIRIGNERFSIILTDELPGLFGHHKPRKKQLLVHTDQSKRDTQATILHEILHEIFRQWKIKLSVGDMDIEEKLVDGLSYALLDLIQNNPEFVKGLLEDKE